MNIFKLMAIAVTALGACGLVAGLSKKAALSKEAAGKSTTVNNVVEAVASAPKALVSLIFTAVLVVVCSAIALIPVTLPLVILCTGARLALIHLLKICVITYLSVAIYDYMYGSILSNSEGSTTC